MAGCQQFVAPNAHIVALFPVGFSHARSEPTRLAQGGDDGSVTMFVTSSAEVPLMPRKYKGKSPDFFQPTYDRLDQLAYGRPQREVPSDRKKKNRGKRKGGGRRSR